MVLQPVIINVEIHKTASIAMLPTENLFINILSSQIDTYVIFRQGSRKSSMNRIGPANFAQLSYRRNFVKKQAVLSAFILPCGPGTVKLRRRRLRD
jgi:hypothetical protein